MRKDPAKQSAEQPIKLAGLQRTNMLLFRAFLLLSELRELYRVPREQATERLQAWLA